jgi:hypothetical protein
MYINFYSSTRLNYSCIYTLWELPRKQFSFIHHPCSDLSASQSALGPAAPISIGPSPGSWLNIRDGHRSARGQRSDTGCEKLGRWFARSLRISGLGAVNSSCVGATVRVVEQVYDWFLLRSVIAAKEVRDIERYSCMDLTGPQGSQCCGLLEALR